MNEPFYSALCVASITDEFVAYRNVYALAPQFCGGAKHVIAHVFPEAIDAIRNDDADLKDIPEPVRNFIKWCDENVVAPPRHKNF